MSTAMRIFRGILLGTLTGLLYYAVFFLFIPMLLRYYNIPTEEAPSFSSSYLLLALALIITMEIAASALRFPLSLPLYLASAALALYIMGSIVSWGKASVQTAISGESIRITVDASPLIAAIAGASILIALLSALEMLGKES
ncbi:MAG: hypothetical protein QXK13_00655 [Fervidicoccaceae archaeon]